MNNLSYQQDYRYICIVRLCGLACIQNQPLFVFSGGKIVVFCHTPEGKDAETSQLVIDSVTDSVLQQSKIHGRPYISPDGRNVVTIDEVGDNISVYKVTDDGMFIW